MIYEHATLVVTTAVATALRKLSQMLDKGDCDGMFQTGLCAVGSPVGTTPSHYISSGMVPKAYITAITNVTARNSSAGGLLERGNHISVHRCSDHQRAE